LSKFVLENHRSAQKDTIRSKQHGVLPSNNVVAIHTVEQKKAEQQFEKMRDLKSKNQSSRAGSGAGAVQTSVTFNSVKNACFRKLPWGPSNRMRKKG